MDMHESLQRILASKQVFGDVFYEALLARHPEVGPYFRNPRIAEPEFGRRFVRGLR